MAFNVAFFLQELFLTLPKALTPGLTATLFHNNHAWSGDNPLARLFQGTGALALAVTAALACLALGSGTRRSAGTQLALWWLAYCAILMTLPQLMAAAGHPGSDLGMAYAYLGVGATAAKAGAFLAIAAGPACAWWLARQAASLDAALGSPEPPTRSCRLLLVPALVALPVLLLYRIPRETVEVVSMPLAVTLGGIFWVCVFGQRATTVRPTVHGVPDWRVPAALASLVLALFQGVLRHGITF